MKVFIPGNMGYNGITSKIEGCGWNVGRLFWEKLVVLFGLCGLKFMREYRGHYINSFGESNNAN